MATRSLRPITSGGRDRLRGTRRGNTSARRSEGKPPAAAGGPRQRRLQGGCLLSGQGHCRVVVRPIPNVAKGGARQGPRYWAAQRRDSLKRAQAEALLHLKALSGGGQRRRPSAVRPQVRNDRLVNGRIMPVYERLSLTTVDWDALDAYADRTVFQTRTWLSFLAQTQQADPVIAVLHEGSQCLGYFTGAIVSTYGLRLLGSPFPGWTTSYMGFNLMPGVPRRLAVSALLPWVFKQLQCVHMEMMDRYLTVEDLGDLGCEYTGLSGFEIDLTQSAETLWANMTSACRQCIRKAAKSGVMIEEAQDLAFAGEYYAQLQDVFAKQALVPTYGVNRVRALIQALQPQGMVLLLRARDPEGRCIATGIFPAMNHTMYFWGGASWRQYQGVRPNEVLHWYAMQYWQARGMHWYDMGGGGEYKKKFGGHPLTVPRFRRSKYPGLGGIRNLAQQLVKLRQRWRGRVEVWSFLVVTLFGDTPLWNSL